MARHTEHLPHGSEVADALAGSILSRRLYLPGLAHLGVFAGSDKVPRGRINAENGSPSGRAFGQLVLTQKLGIYHPAQVINFDYSTDIFPFYVPGCAWSCA